MPPLSEDSDVELTNNSPSGDEASIEYLSGFKLAAVFFAISLSVFLVSFIQTTFVAGRWLTHDCLIRLLST